jgi:DNA polymerase-3 subunit delta'
MVDALQKVCHDALAMSQGAAPRFFAAAQMPGGASPVVLSAWSETLARTARNAGHPWNEGLLGEALVSAGASAWADATGHKHASAKPVL